MTELAIATLETGLTGALELGGRALAWAEAQGLPILASASFETCALVLGALQQVDTLQLRSRARFDASIERRRSTGTEAQLDGAVLYHALALPRVDALFADASSRTLLNRNLRALLRGYTAAGVPLRYFGTEVLALLGHPVALIGYDQTASGAILLEVLVGLENPCVVRPALPREPPAALFQLLRASPDPRTFLSRVVDGIVERLGRVGVDVAVSLPAANVDLAPPVATVRSASVSIPLGVVEASIEPRVQIYGDLLASRASLEQVEALASSVLRAGSPLLAEVVAPLERGPLDGARPADVLTALQAAQQLMTSR